MTLFPKVDMKEATRLTREGRLEEAMQLLQKGPTLNAPPSPTSDTGLQRRVRAWTSPGALGALQKQPTLTGFRTPQTRHAVPAIPAGARYEERAFANDVGTRSYKIYVPASYNGAPMPLVVMLHGCTQSPDDFALGTRMNDVAEERGFLVAYPAQPQSANMSRCWNWFRPGDQHRDGGEPALIAGVTRQIMGEFAVESDRAYVAGLSAGGAAAAIMGSTHPDLYAAIGVHSGLACGAASDIPSALMAMKQGSTAQGGSSHTRMIVFHGDSDSTVHPINADQVIAQSRAAEGLRARVIRGQEGGMPYTQTIHGRDDGCPVLEQWILHGGGHAWSGGSAEGTYADPRGPDASREMIRFFLADRPS